MEKARGLRLFLVLGCVSVIGPASMDSYLPGLPELADDFGVSSSAAQLTLTTFLVGLAVGQLVAGPLSDVHGRRRPLVAGMALFACATFLCALAPSLAALAVLRFLQGTLAAFGMAIGRAVIRDLYSGAAASRYLARLVLIIGLAPLLAPLVGGQILRFTSWRGVFLALAVLGLAITTVTICFLPETLKHDRRRDAGLGLTVKAFATLLRDRSFVRYILIIGLSGGAMTGYIAASSFVFQDVYGASPQTYGLLFGISALFLVAGSQINAHLLRNRAPRGLLGFGLMLMVTASIGILVVVPFAEAGLVLIMVPVAVLMFSFNFIQSNSLALALTDHPEAAGTAAGLFGLTQFAFSAVVAPLTGLAGTDTALLMAGIVATCAIGAALSFGLRAPRRPRRSGAAAEGAYELEPE